MLPQVFAFTNRALFFFPLVVAGCAAFDDDDGPGYPDNGEPCTAQTGGSIEHNGSFYEEVTSPRTGRVWLDRNLGACRPCESPTDTQCFGDYYQWGRQADGHQKLNSGVLSYYNSIDSEVVDVRNVGHGDFISISFGIEYGDYDDWAPTDFTGEERSSAWGASDGTSVCPPGFRVPSYGDLSAEFESVSYADVASSALRIPAAGWRDDQRTDMREQGSEIFLWTTSRSEFDAYSSPFVAHDIFSMQRTNGLPVRCLSTE